MLGELFNHVMDEVGGKDLTTRRAITSPFRALSTIFDIKAAGTIAATSAAVLDGPHSAL